MKRWSRCGRVLLLALLVALLGAGCGSSQTPPAAAPRPADAVTQDSPPYAKLAALEEGSRNPAPSTLAAFQTIMGSLGQKCGEDSAQSLSDYVVKSQQLLKDKGVVMKLSEVARAADHSIPDGRQKGHCADVFALLVTLTNR